MLDETIAPEDITSKITFHDRLNPDLWGKDGMHLEVRVRLLRAALSFYRFLGLPGLVVKDVIVTGSNASFNYTPLSDVDLHLVVDYATTECPETAANLFTTKKSLWNETHRIFLRGHPVELYVQDTATPVEANGIFSVLRGKWIKEPDDAVPTWDEDAVVTKTEILADRIDALLNDPTLEAIEAALSALHAMRKKGLSDGGEFSVDNLVYKSLRNLGYIDRLYDTKQRILDQDLSI